MSRPKPAPSGRPASARPAAALAARPSSALPRAHLQRPMSAMGRPITSDLQAGPSHRPPPTDHVRPASALGLRKDGLPDFRPPPTQCPTAFDRHGYAAWEAGAKGREGADFAEVLDKLSKAPLKERKRPGQMAKHVESLKPKFAAIDEILDALPKDDKTRASILAERANVYKDIDDCLPLAYVPPVDLEEEKAREMAEWEAAIGGNRPKSEESRTKADDVSEEGVVDPVTGRLDVAMFSQYKQAETLAEQVKSLDVTSAIPSETLIVAYVYFISHSYLPEERRRRKRSPKAALSTP